MFCVVCLVAASDARAQAGTGQGGAPVGYGPPLSASGGQGAYSGPGANFGAEQRRPESGIMGILPRPSPGVAAPRFTPNPEAIGVPTTPGVAVTACMNRNPPEGTVITKSVRQSSCGDQCESEIQIPAGQRMLICRGQAIPKGYTLELLTTTPDCSCFGRDQNAYMIKAETANDEFRQALPQ
jgi:hypothetical protein